MRRMSDQGYPDPTGPSFGQDPNYGQQPPPYGQQQPPYGPQQPPYGQQPPPYGQPPAVPQLGAEGTPPQYPGYPAPGTTGGGGGGRRGLIISSVVGVLVALGVGAFFLFSGGSAGADTPKDVVAKFFDAGKANNVAAAGKLVCAKDVANHVVNELGSSGGRVKTYTIK